MRRIVVDARMVGPIGHGISQYVTGLAKGLIGENRGGYEVVYLVSDNLPKKEFPWNHVATYALSAPFLHPSELWEIPRALKRLDADLYHSPSFSSLLWSPCPWVVTVHDLNHLQYGSTFKKLYYRWILRRFILRASQVVSVSQTSVQEIQAWLGNPRARVDVVPNAIELLGSSPVDLLLSHHELTEKKYFIALSSSKPHKNLSLLAEAFIRWKELHADAAEWKLVIANRTDIKNDSIVSLQGIRPDEVSGLLRKAGALVFPSLYEGFGRPPLEAIASGVPVVVSDIPVHREALSGIPSLEVCLKWASPHRVEDWLEGFDAVRREELTAPRMEACAWVLETYSAEKSGRLMDEIYRRALA